MHVIKTVIFDMYGVIIKESKGTFIPFVRGYFPNLARQDILPYFRKASVGEISSKEFLQRLGFLDWEEKQQEYLEDHVTFDKGFFTLADKLYGKYKMALLSNDVSEWSMCLTEKYNLNRYFDCKVVSGDVGYKKPKSRIFEIVLQKLGQPAGECVFIDNSIANLLAAKEIGLDTILFNRDGEEYDGKVVYSFEELSTYF